MSYVQFVHPCIMVPHVSSVYPCLTCHDIRWPDKKTVPPCLICHDLTETANPVTLDIICNWSCTWTSTPRRPVGTDCFETPPRSHHVAFDSNIAQNANIHGVIDGFVSIYAIMYSDLANSSNIIPSCA